LRFVDVSVFVHAFVKPKRELKQHEIEIKESAKDIVESIKYYYIIIHTMKVKVTRNYQITIPAEIRRKLNLKLGDILDVSYDEVKREIVIKKIPERRKTLKAGRMLMPEEIEEIIKRGLEESL
jgi:AbrB family looped-hinge helix DNA binding protein